MELAPQIQNHRTAMQSSSIQPVTNRILVDLQDPTGRPERISFRQGAYGCLEKRRIAFQTIVGSGVTQGHTTPTTFTECLRLTMTGAIFDHFARSKRNTIVSTPFVRTIE